MRREPKLIVSRFFLSFYFPLLFSNLATYATLFGLPWLEPIMWVWQRWLYSKSVLLSSLPFRVAFR